MRPGFLLLLLLPALAWGEGTPSKAQLEQLSFDKNHTVSDCVLVMFYAPWCHFCAATAPHYNAVARAFPQLEVLAVDTVHFSK